MNIQELVRSYQSGEVLSSISKRFNVSTTSLCRILVKEGVYGRDISSRGFVNVRFFEVIDSWEKAYMLGLMESDGNINPKNYRITYTQTNKYLYYIEDLVRTYIKLDVNTKESHSAYLRTNVSFCSKTMMADLISKGIVPNKSYLQTEEEVAILWNSVPEEWKGAFLRGLLDGDGSVSVLYNKEVLIKSYLRWMGNLKLMKLVKEWLEGILGEGVYLYEQGKCGVVYVGRRFLVRKVCEMLVGEKKEFKGHPLKTERINKILKSYSENS